MLARGILFDFNGVIANDESLHYRALTAVLAGHDIAVTRDQYDTTLLGLDDRATFTACFERAGRTADKFQLDWAVEQKALVYEELARDELELVPGVADFIDAAATARIALAVASSALRREIEFVLEMRGLRDYFETVVSAEEVRSRKPDPQVFLMAAQRLRLRPADCVVIEDSRPGIAAARAGGFRSVAITSSLPASALSDADLVWDTFTGHYPNDLPWTDA
jgi:HAD superfamily hydrolase (TIGR01509 family)